MNNRFRSKCIKGVTIGECWERIEGIAPPAPVRSCLFCSCFNFVSRVFAPYSASSTKRATLKSSSAGSILIIFFLIEVKTKENDWATAWAKVLSGRHAQLNQMSVVFRLPMVARFPAADQEEWRLGTRVFLYESVLLPCRPLPQAVFASLTRLALRKIKFYRRSTSGDISHQNTPSKK